MADTYGGPFATYDNSSGVINGTGKTELYTNLTNFAALFGVTLDTSTPASATHTLLQEEPNPHPDFDRLDPEMRDKIGVELAEMVKSIAAASEA